MRRVARIRDAAWTMVNRCASAYENFILLMASALRLQQRWLSRLLLLSQNTGPNQEVNARQKKKIAHKIDANKYLEFRLIWIIIFEYRNFEYLFVFKRLYKKIRETLALLANILRFRKKKSRWKYVLEDVLSNRRYINDIWAHLFAFMGILAHN